MVFHHWLYFSGFVITGILLIGATLMGIVDGLSTLSGSVPTSEEFILLAMLGAATEWVMVVLVLGLVAMFFLAATVISVLRTASLPRDNRLVSIIKWAEQRYPALRQFDVTEKVSPTAEDRRQQLKDQYISGEVSDAKFEREMEQLMNEAASKEKSQSGTGITTEINDKSR